MRAKHHQLGHLQFSFINPLLTSVLITFDWSHVVHNVGKSFHTIWKSKINGMLYPNLFLNNTEELPTCKLTCVGGKISLGLSMPRRNCNGKKSSHFKNEF